MRAVALHSGELLVRDDVPEPEPGVRPGARRGEGVRHLRVRPALRQARRRRCSRSARRWRACPTHRRRRPRRSTSTRTCSWATSSRPRCSRSGPTPSGPAPGTIVTSIPILLTDDRHPRPIVYSNDAAGGYGERMLLSAPMLVEVPNGLDPRHAALTEPMAVGLHARQQVAASSRARARSCSAAGRSASPSSPR